MNDTITKKDLQEEFDTFGKSIDRNFELIDQRLDVADKRYNSIDQRLNSIDQRFDTVDQRLNSIDQRFDSMDCRFDKIEEQIEDLALMTKVQFDDLDRRLSILGARSRGFGLWP